MLQLVESPKMLMLLTLETDGVSPETELASEDPSEEPMWFIPAVFSGVLSLGDFRQTPQLLKFRFVFETLSSHIVIAQIRTLS